MDNRIYYSVVSRKTWHYLVQTDSANIMYCKCILTTDYLRNEAQGYQLRKECRNVSLIAICLVSDFNIGCIGIRMLT